MKQLVSGMTLAIVAFTIWMPAFWANAQVRSIKEPPPRDPNVVNGTVDTKFSRDWWTQQNRKFRQALSDENAALIVSAAREVVGGAPYNAPATYNILDKAVRYLQKAPLDHVDDLGALMTARAEAAQYVLADETARDWLAAEILCTSHELATLYKQSGRDALALQAFEHYYHDGRAERERLMNAPHTVPLDCPCDDKTMFMDLIEAHLAVALSGDCAPDTAQRHFRAAFDCNNALMEQTDINMAFSWDNEKLSAYFGSPRWSAASLTLGLARKMGVPPPEYVRLAGEVVKKSTGPEPFSLGDSIAGHEYLETKGAGETQLWEFLEIYQAYFGGWPDGINGAEYQRNALTRLNVAIQCRDNPRAQAVLAELSRVSFADPASLEEFKRIRSGCQGAGTKEGK